MEEAVAEVIGVVAAGIAETFGVVAVVVEAEEVVASRRSDPILISYLCQCVILNS